MREKCISVPFPSVRRVLSRLAAVTIVLSSVVLATPVYNTSVDSMDWSGSRTVGSPVGGLGSTGGVFPEGSGIAWLILNNGDGTLTYTYRFFSPGVEGQEVQLELSHFILELSQGCNDEGSGCVQGFNGDVEYNSAWGSSPSNPGIPGSIYGIKFDEGQAEYTFVSNRMPVWGHFYAKKSDDGMWNLALTGLEEYQEDTLYFIPRPDTDQPAPPIPEPGTMALLGAGVVAMGLLRSRRRA